MHHNPASAGSTFSADLQRILSERNGDEGGDDAPSVLPARPRH